MSRMQSLLFVTAVIVLCCPFPSNAEVQLRSFQAEGMRFELGDGSLRISFETEQDSCEVRFETQGALFVDGGEVICNRSARKLLRQFFRECEKFADGIDQITAELAAGREPGLGDSERKSHAKRVQRLGEQLNKQSEGLARIASDLVERIPELALLERLVEP